jgi:hypothetical protein
MKLSAAHHCNPGLVHQALSQTGHMIKSIDQVKSTRPGLVNRIIVS